MRELDEAVEQLVANQHRWARTSTAARIEILDAVKNCLQDVAIEWVAAAVANKRIPEHSPLVGEEWLSGPYSLMAGCNAFAETLRDIEGKSFLDKLKLRKTAGDRIAVRVLPHSIWDRVLLSGVEAEVWMQPGVTESNLASLTASSYDVPEEQRKGSVALVLGAGNIASIAPLDCFHKLFVEHSVVLLKLNPVNDYLYKVLTKALRPLIQFGALRIVRGGVEVGEYLCNHDAIDSIHITGAESSHDAIVWGVGADGAANKRSGTPRNTRRITSELGAVCPTIIVPGPWTDADIRFQAEHVATQKLHNSGFNCIACQVLVMPENWDAGEKFLAEVRSAIRGAPPRAMYYPGAEERVDNFRSRYPSAEDLSEPEAQAERVVIPFDQSGEDHLLETQEVFAPVLGVTGISGDDAEDYLRNAIAYCNEQLHGTLGANIIIHPATRRTIGDRWDEIVADLKYGCIAINAWTGLGFLTVQTPWGAFPGHTLDDIQSGMGFVHNTFMFDKPERTVIEAPFRPFPRSILNGSLSLLPKPPWFVTNRKAAALGRRLTDFQFKPGFLKIPGILFNALLG